MNESKFLQISEETLINLADLIEDNDKNSIFDVEYSDGILNLSIFETNQQQYVINKHSASQKIWFSSPISGAKYFAFDEKQNTWLDDNRQELGKTLIAELQNNFKFKIN